MNSDQQPEHLEKLEYTAHRMPGNVLSETLNEKTVVELRELARAYRIKRAASMKKSDLVLAVSLSLQDPGRMEEVLYILEPLAWRLFQRAAKGKMVDISSEPISSYYFLQQLG